jgi:hypothetical protein
LFTFDKIVYVNHSHPPFINLDELKHIFNIIFEKNIVLVEENLIIGVYEGEITEDLLLVNLVICILKWVIWKTRNYIKY